jgi:S-adenosyl methyltransferase
VILRRAAEALDSGQPAAVMPPGVHLIQDTEDPRGIVARLMERGPEPGVRRGVIV